MKKISFTLLSLFVLPFLVNCASPIIEKYYTITWQNYDGTVLATDEVKEGKLPFYQKETPERPDDESLGLHYTFAAWSPEIVTASNNTTYTATYDSSLIDYSITYHNVSGSTHSNPVSYNHESETITLNKANKAGYNFANWHKDSLTGEIITEIPHGSTGNFNIYAEWGDPITYTITYKNLDQYHPAEHNNPTLYTIESDTIHLKDPTNSGYNFIGWHKDSLSGNFITEIPRGSTGDLTLFAEWGNTPVRYTINYLNTLGALTNPNPVYYYYTSDDIQLQGIAKNGYDFLHWRLGSKDGEIITKIPKNSTGNLFLYAVWDKVEYTINYHNLNFATTDNPTSYTITTPTFSLTDPTGAIYTKFLGWHKGSLDGELISSVEKGSFGNLDLYAAWNTELVTYQIDYKNINDGIHDNPDTYTYETETITLNNANRTGYDFLEWHLGSLTGPTITEIPKGSHGDLEIWADWRACVYDTYFNATGGTFGDLSYIYLDYCDEREVEKLEIPKGESFNPYQNHVPSRDGYNFMGWYHDKEYKHPVSNNDAFSIGEILYAKWNQTTDKESLSKHLGSVTDKIPFGSDSFSVSYVIPTGYKNIKFRTLHLKDTSADFLYTINVNGKNILTITEVSDAFISRTAENVQAGTLVDINFTCEGEFIRVPNIERTISLDAYQDCSTSVKLDSFYLLATYDTVISGLVPVPYRESYEFIGWLYNGAIIDLDSKWTITEEATLEAVWNLTN